MRKDRVAHRQRCPAGSGTARKGQRPGLRRSDRWCRACLPPVRVSTTSAASVANVFARTRRRARARCAASAHVSQSSSAPEQARPTAQIESASRRERSRTASRPPSLRGHAAAGGDTQAVGQIVICIETMYTAATQLRGGVGGARAGRRGSYVACGGIEAGRGEVGLALILTYSASSNSLSARTLE